MAFRPIRREAGDGPIDSDHPEHGYTHLPIRVEERCS